MDSAPENMMAAPEDLLDQKFFGVRTWARAQIGAEGVVPERTRAAVAAVVESSLDALAAHEEDVSRLMQLGFRSSGSRAPSAVQICTYRSHALVLAYLLQASLATPLPANPNLSLRSLFVLLNDRKHDRRARARFRLRWERVWAAGRGARARVDSIVGPGRASVLLDLLRTAAHDDEVAGEFPPQDPQSSAPAPKKATKRKMYSDGPAERTERTRSKSKSMSRSRSRSAEGEDKHDSVSPCIFSEADAGHHLQTLRRLLTVLPTVDQKVAVVQQALGGTRALDIFTVPSYHSAPISSAQPWRAHPDLYQSFVLHVLEDTMPALGDAGHDFASRIGF